MDHLVFRPTEQTSVEFSSEEFPDAVIRIDNVRSHLEANTKLRRLLAKLVNTDGLRFDVIGPKQELRQS